MGHKILKDFPRGTKCEFCLTRLKDVPRMGNIYQTGDVFLHYFCMLLASEIEQKGSDNQGLLGFYTRDIKVELKRGSNISCYYCKKKGATVTCCDKTCNINFHLPCAQQKGSLHQFFDEFKSFCPKHKPIQEIPASLTEKDWECITCGQLVKLKCKPSELFNKSAVWTTCCRPEAFVHRRCLQEYAFNSGYYFKCPFCANKEEFADSMKTYGIYVPDQEASWERDRNAYSDLEAANGKCIAKKCLCPKGVNYCTKPRKKSNAQSKKTKKKTITISKWHLEKCMFCGHNGLHWGCSPRSEMWKIQNHRYVCDTCSAATNLENEIAQSDADESVPVVEKNKVREKEKTNETRRDSPLRNISQNATSDDDVVLISSDSEDEELNVEDTNNSSMNPRKRQLVYRRWLGPKRQRLSSAETSSATCSTSRERTCPSMRGCSSNSSNLTFSMLSRILEETCRRRRRLTGEHSPPTEEHSPPTEEHSPPTEEHSPSTEEHSLPAEEHSLPTEEHPPPTEEHPSMANVTDDDSDSHEEPLRILISSVCTLQGRQDEISPVSIDTVAADDPENHSDQTMGTVVVDRPENNREQSTGTIWIEEPENRSETQPVACIEIDDSDDEVILVPDSDSSLFDSDGSCLDLSTVPESDRLLLNNLFRKSVDSETPLKKKRRQKKKKRVSQKRKSIDSGKQSKNCHNTLNNNRKVKKSKKSSGTDRGNSSVSDTNSLHSPEFLCESNLTSKTVSIAKMSKEYSVGDRSSGDSSITVGNDSSCDNLSINYNNISNDSNRLSSEPRSLPYNNNSLVDITATQSTALSGNGSPLSNGIQGCNRLETGNINTIVNSPDIHLLPPKDNVPDSENVSPIHYESIDNELGSVNTHSKGDDLTNDGFISFSRLSLKDTELSSSSLHSDTPSTEKNGTCEKSEKVVYSPKDNRVRVRSLPISIVPTKPCNSSVVIPVANDTIMIEEKLNRDPRVYSSKKKNASTTNSSIINNNNNKIKKLKDTVPRIICSLPFEQLVFGGEINQVNNVSSKKDSGSSDPSTSISSNALTSFVQVLDGSAIAKPPQLAAKFSQDPFQSTVQKVSSSVNQIATEPSKLGKLKSKHGSEEDVKLKLSETNPKDELGLRSSRSKPDNQICPLEEHASLHSSRLIISSTNENIEFSKSSSLHDLALESSGLNSLDCQSGSQSKLSRDDTNLNDELVVQHSESSPSKDHISSSQSNLNTAHHEQLESTKFVNKSEWEKMFPKNGDSSTNFNTKKELCLQSSEVCPKNKAGSNADSQSVEHKPSKDERQLTCANKIAEQDFSNCEGLNASIKSVELGSSLGRTCHESNPLQSQSNSCVGQMTFTDELNIQSSEISSSEANIDFPLSKLDNSMDIKNAAVRAVGSELTSATAEEDHLEELSQNSLSGGKIDNRLFFRNDSPPMYDLNMKAPERYAVCNSKCSTCENSLSFISKQDLPSHNSLSCFDCVSEKNPDRSCYMETLSYSSPIINSKTKNGLSDVPPLNVSGNIPLNDKIAN